MSCDRDSFLHCQLPFASYLPAICHLPLVPHAASSCSRPICLCLCRICHTIQQLWPSTLCFSLFNSFGYWTRLLPPVWCPASCCLGWRLQHLGNLSQTLCESYKFVPQFVQNFWATLGCNSLTRSVSLSPCSPCPYHSLSLHSQYLLHKRSTKINVQMGRISVAVGCGRGREECGRICWNQFALVRKCCQVAHLKLTWMTIISTSMCHAPHRPAHHQSAPPTWHSFAFAPCLACFFQLFFPLLWHSTFIWTFVAVSAVFVVVILTKLASVFHELPCASAA